MEVLTHRSGTDYWTRWPSVVRGLLVAAWNPSHCVVLYSDRPDEEREELADAARLVRRAGGEAVSIAVASPQAGGRWQDDLHIAGVHEIWMVERLDRRTGEDVRLRVVPEPGPVRLRGEPRDERPAVAKSR